MVILSNDSNLINGRIPIRALGYTVGSVLPRDAMLYPLLYTLKNTYINNIINNSIDSSITIDNIINPHYAIDLPFNLDERNAVLAQWADRLYNKGHIKTWRNELLSVAAWLEPNHIIYDLPLSLAQIERGAARALGILTHAVHLVGESIDGKIWLQQRALSKATDPGLWDSLSGGLLSNTDELESGILRETYEEAGLVRHDFSHFSMCGMVQEHRNTNDGYINQAVWAYRAVLLPHSIPRNLDGEVMQFNCVTLDQLKEYIATQQVSYEAILAFKLAKII